MNFVDLADGRENSVRSFFKNHRNVFSTRLFHVVRPFVWSARAL